MELVIYNVSPVCTIVHDSFHPDFIEEDIPAIHLTGDKNISLKISKYVY